MSRKAEVEKAQIPEDGSPFTVCDQCGLGVHFLNIRKAEIKGMPSHDCRGGALSDR